MILQGIEYKQYRCRIQWIDIARCISIAIIVYAHTYDQSLISDFVHVFHVPVFFVLSGLVWKKAENAGSLLKSLLINLIIPYFIVGGISIAAYQIMGSMFSTDKLSLFQCVKGLIYANSRTGLMKWNRPLWFIPCLVVTRILWELISQIKKEYTQYILVVIVVTFGAISLKTQIANIALPWEAEVSVHALLYFAIGVAVKRHTIVCRKNFESRVSRPLKILVPAISFAVCVLVFRFNPRPISFQYNQYGIYPLFVAGALAGTCLIGGVSVAIGKCKLFEIVGQNSLGVLLWHKFPVLLFQMSGLGNKCLKTPDTAESILIGIIVLLFTIAVSLFAGIIIKKILKPLYKN